MVLVLRRLTGTAATFPAQPNTLSKAKGVLVLVWPCVCVAVAAGLGGCASGGGVVDEVLFDLDLSHEGSKAETRCMAMSSSSAGQRPGAWEGIVGCSLRRSRCCAGRKRPASSGRRWRNLFGAPRGK